MNREPFSVSARRVADDALRARLVALCTELETASLATDGPTNTEAACALIDCLGGALERAAAAPTADVVVVYALLFRLRVEADKRGADDVAARARAVEAAMDERAPGARAHLLEALRTLVSHGGHA